MMKRIRFLRFIFFAVLVSCQGNVNQGDSDTHTSTRTDRVEVIDFYGTHRCMTCEAIEENTKFTVEAYFADELNSGKVTFRAVNVDKEENFDIARKFEVAGTALFLNVIRDGGEEQIDLTSFAFTNGLDKEVFTAELRELIETQLRTL